jgi:quinol-cytochrome oxidoreductase complex cytochrome b subunit
MKRYKKSTIIPLALLVYLIGMSYIGRLHFYAGEYVFYFGVIGVTLFIIVLLHFMLKKREKMQQKREGKRE